MRRVMHATARHVHARGYWRVAMCGSAVGSNCVERRVHGSSRRGCEMKKHMSIVAAILFVAGVAGTAPMAADSHANKQNAKASKAAVKNERKAIKQDVKADKRDVKQDNAELKRLRADLKAAEAAHDQARAAQDRAAI